MSEWKEYKLSDFMEFNPKISLKKDVIARKITMDQLNPDMTLNDWRHIIEAYTPMVREASHFNALEISMQPEQIGMVAEDISAPKPDDEPDS